MKLIQLAAASLNQTPLAWETNKQHIVSAITAAKEEGVSILCLPELCITGYGCEDAFHSPGIIATAHTVLQEIIPTTKDIIVAIGVPLFFRGGLYDAAALVCDGNLLGFACKQNLAGDGIHYEPRWFRRWSAGAVHSIQFDGVETPIGDLLFKCGGVSIGFEICEDAWVPDRPGARLAKRGVDILLNPSASHFAFGKQKVREQFVQEGSRAFHCSYVYANLLGNEAGRAIYDGGNMIASGGKIISRSRPFSYADWQLNTAIVDVDATRMKSAQSAVDPNEAADAVGETIRADFSYPKLSVKQKKQQDNSESKNRLHKGCCISGEEYQQTWETGPYAKEEEFARAVALSLFDYLRKSRSCGFVVSLSGGADSAAVALLIWLSVRFGGTCLGWEFFKEKLGYIFTEEDSPDRIPEPKEPWQALVRRLLVCVYQSTRNSGETTRNAAQELAEAVGAEFLAWDVDALVEGYTTVVSHSIGRTFDWKTDDIALQNIQARTRAPGVWLLANVRNALLLSTSNRSEAAVGYATMDGDTCGGLAPIAGIDKAFLLHWLKWMETTGPEGIGPLPALSVINDQQPTAELRPAASKQTDEQDLMPYDLLDAIERAAIRDKLMPLEVYQVIAPNFPQYDAKSLGAWVERFFRLWCRNQWKRERYAPSFHLDDENLDPKTWCRFPILSGGYERELKALKKYVEGLTP